MRLPPPITLATRGAFSPSSRKFRDAMALWVEALNLDVEKAFSDINTACRLFSTEQSQTLVASFFFLANF
jgi:hypothetical protein